jgi:hypothetical protein
MLTIPTSMNVLGLQTYYKLPYVDHRITNPEQRICEGELAFPGTRLNICLLVVLYGPSFFFTWCLLASQQVQWNIDCLYTALCLHQSNFLLTVRRHPEAGRQPG